MEEFNVSYILMAISALILGITVHEWAHAVSADYFGDTTPRSQGRVTLWPPAHLDPMGTIFMIATVIFGFGIGWGKPVQTDPRQYRINPRLADSIVSFAGPLSNLVIAMAFALLWRTGLVRDPMFMEWMFVIIIVNTGLFLFNLIPIYPLDGYHLLANALPPRLGDAYRQAMQQYGIFIFIALLMLRIPSELLGPAIVTMIKFLIG
jgi:Zn-dependent protease